MFVQKHNGKVLGAKLTSAERKALEIELDKMLAEDLRSHEDEIIAIVLYTLGKEFGFGSKRMFRFWQALQVHFIELCEHYEMSPTKDGLWLMTRKLKEEKGVDVAEWQKQSKLKK